jgi:hypothetical protein
MMMTYPIFGMPEKPRFYLVYVQVDFDWVLKAVGYITSDKEEKLKDFVAKQYGADVYTLKLSDNSAMLFEPNTDPVDYYFVGAGEIKDYLIYVWYPDRKTALRHFLAGIASITENNRDKLIHKVCKQYRVSPEDVELKEPARPEVEIWAPNVWCFYPDSEPKEEMIK